MTAKCHNCGREYLTARALAGKAIPCRSCGAMNDGGGGPPPAQPEKKADRDKRERAPHAGSLLIVDAAPAATNAAREAIDAMPDPRRGNRMNRAILRMGIGAALLAIFVVTGLFVVRSFELKPDERRDRTNEMLATPQVVTEKASESSYGAIATVAPLATPKPDAGPGAGYGGIAPVAPPAPAPAPAPSPAPTPTPTPSPSPSPTSTPAPVVVSPSTNSPWQKKLDAFTASLKERTEKFKALKPSDQQTSSQFETDRLAEARKIATNTAEALLEILALDRARKLEAASDPQITDELRQDRNGFVIRFGEGAKYKIPELASSPLRDSWLAFIEAVKSQLELINSDQRSDQLRDAWNAGLDDYLAALDPKAAKDLVAVKGGVTKFLQFNGEKLPPDLIPEIKAQEKARNP
jgi:hypothetical protein